MGSIVNTIPDKYAIQGVNYSNGNVYDSSKMGKQFR